MKNNTTKSAWVANFETAEGFRVEFPMDNEELRSTFRSWYALDVWGDGGNVHIAEIEGFYGFASTFCDLEELNDIAERIEALEDKDAEKLEAMAEVVDDLDDIESAWDDSYFFSDTTLAAYAELHAEESGFLEAVPDFIRGYIDWEDMAEDMKIDEGYSEINGGVLYVAK